MNEISLRMEGVDVQLKVHPDARVTFDGKTLTIEPAAPFGKPWPFRDEDGSYQANLQIVRK